MAWLVAPSAKVDGPTRGVIHPIADLSRWDQTWFSAPAIDLARSLLMYSSA